MSAEIRRRLEARPFQPFKLQMTDGKEYPVPTPDHAHVHPSNFHVSVYTDDDLAYYLSVRQIIGLSSDLVEK
jgi:hypothetical protein